MAEKKTGNKPGFFPASPNRENVAEDAYKDDKFTIQDIVKLTEKRNSARFKFLGDERGAYAKRGNLLNISDTADEILAEKDPTRPRAGGTYEGSVYYSNILPQGEDKTPWSKRGSNLVSKAAKSNAKKKDILAAQSYFVDIGYMHPSEVDGMKGKQLMGMIRRWNLNAGTSKEAMFDGMKNWKDNLFDGGAEEYEEDLREGGGDQGGY